MPNKPAGVGRLAAAQGHTRVPGSLPGSSAYARDRQRLTGPAASIHSRRSFAGAHATNSRPNGDTRGKRWPACTGGRTDSGAADSMTAMKSPLTSEMQAAMSIAEHSCCNGSRSIREIGAFTGFGRGRRGPSSYLPLEAGNHAAPSRRRATWPGWRDRWTGLSQLTKDFGKCQGGRGGGREQFDDSDDAAGRRRRVLTRLST